MFKLGNPGDLRTYNLQTARAYQRANANQFAARVNTSQDYGTLESWSEWAVQNWSNGVGQRNPEHGGTLYAHADTRFGEQVILPFGLNYVDKAGCFFSSFSYVNAELSWSASQMWATSFQPGSNVDVTLVWVYIDAPAGANLTIHIYDSILLAWDLPGSSLGSGSRTISSRLRPGARWFLVSLDAAVSLTANYLYWIVIDADQPLTAPAVQPAEGRVAAWHDGAQWAQTTYGFPLLLSFGLSSGNLQLQDGTGNLLWQDGDTVFFEQRRRISKLTQLGEHIYAARDTELLRWDDASSSWTIEHDFTYTITDMISVEDKILLATDAGLYEYDPISGTPTAHVAWSAQLLLLHGGYLYRSFGNNIWYTTDLVSWTGPIAVGFDGYTVRGMAGLESDIYFATDSGLYKLAGLDVAIPITRWPSVDSRNGHAMVEWQGALYIPLTQDLMQYSSAGLQVVGLNQGEGLPSDLAGYVYQLLPTTYYLLASVEAVEPDGFGSLWAYNKAGWHNIGRLPDGVAGGALLLDTQNSELWMTGSSSLTARVHFPTSVVNPIKDPVDRTFERDGWIEFDWFIGGSVRLQKDWESVYIDGENFSGSRYVDIYYLESEAAGWQYLGRAASGADNVRWSIDDYRPTARRMRLGLRLHTDDVDESPVLMAHVVQFRQILVDRARWHLLIPTNPNLQLVDGTLSAYTQAQMQAHLDTLARQVSPFIYEDLAGSQYEVVCTDWSWRVEEYEYNGQAIMADALAMTIEEIVPYAP